MRRTTTQKPASICRGSIHAFARRRRRQRRALRPPTAAAPAKGGQGSAGWPASVDVPDCSGLSRTAKVQAEVDHRLELARRRLARKPLVLAVVSLVEGRRAGQSLARWLSPGDRGRRASTNKDRGKAHWDGSCLPRCHRRSALVQKIAATLSPSSDQLWSCPLRRAFSRHCDQRKSISALVACASRAVCRPGRICALRLASRHRARARSLRVGLQGNRHHTPRTLPRLRRLAGPGGRLQPLHRRPQ